jgi:uncharacterized protein (DUF302 family)
VHGVIWLKTAREPGFGMGRDMMSNDDKRSAKGDEVPVRTPRRYAGDEVVSKASPWSVADTVSRLSSAVAARGMKLFAVIDQSQEAKDVGLELRDTKLVMFGSPQAGTPVMAAAPLAALDLPLKVAVWSDGDQTKVSYTAPEALAARYGLSDELAARLAGINALTDAVIDR